MRCHLCGKKATIKDVDPFCEELPDLCEDEENTEEWWCEECYQDRHDDI